MTLAYSIDRATFRSLVDEALRRIPTASRGQWTLHAPVDPGITLVELFAWLLEQRSFWADQVTAPLVRATMALFGDGIHGARAAGTAITFSPELEPDPHRAFQPHAVMSRRTPLRIADTDVVFTLHQGLFALALDRYVDAPKMPKILVGGDSDGAVEEDLRSGRPIAILAAHGKPSAIELGFVLIAATPASAPEAVSIGFELDTTVPPEWSPDAATAAPPATLRWEYKTATGAWQALPALRDGTLGLRRSGTVRFELPADWSAGVLDGDGRYVAWIRISTDAATFAAPPSVQAILPNSGLAYHYQWKSEGGVPQWLPLPGRTFQLARGPLPLPARTAVFVGEYDGQHRYRVVPDFTQVGPEDRVVVVDRARGAIVFGDGLTGRIPRLDPHAIPQVLVVFEAGGGDAGNVPGCAWEPLAGPLGSARSYVTAVGGLDEESLDDARLRATAALRIPTRAVNPDDHEAIARATPGVAVARAHAEVGLDLEECGVVPGVTTVFVVPAIHSRTRDDVRAGTAIAAPVADPGLLAAVRIQFCKTRLVGERIAVVAAHYRHLRIRVTVRGAPHDPADVRARVSASLRGFLDPLIGGAAGEGWPFGEPVRPTALLGVAQAELGDRGEVDRVDIAIDGGVLATCDDVVIRPYELVTADAIEVVIESMSSQEAGLR